MIEDKKNILNNAYLMAMLPPLFWAGNFIISKPLLVYISPVGLSFFRWLLCTLILVPFALRQTISYRKIIRENIDKILVFSFLGIAGFNCLIYIGLTKTSAINAAIINSSMPIVTLIMAMIIVGERLTLNRLIGVTFVVIGIAWIAFEGNIQNLISFSFGDGDVFILLGVCCWALYTVLARKWPVSMPLIVLVFIISLLGSLAHIPFLFFESGVGIKDYLDFALLAKLLYLAIFPSSLAYILWTKAIIKMGPGKTSLFMYFMPVYSAILAVVFLNEALFMYHVYGFLLIATGLYIAMKVAKGTS